MNLALARVTAKIAGGLHLPAARPATATSSLKTYINCVKEKGVQFHFNQTISRIDHNGLRIKAVETETGRFEADAVVCALGCFSRTVLAQLDLNLPIYPVKGYSLTLPVTNSDGAPVSTVLDESYKVAITRFDNRIRVGGMAELSGYEIKLSEKTPRNAGFGRQRFVPRGRRFEPSIVLERPPTDDARQHTANRAHPF